MAWIDLNDLIGLIDLADGTLKPSLSLEEQPNSGGFFHDRCGSY
ncbi:hypothetical protein QUF95_21075 [Paenibacillus silvae]|nr:hypothetical protein [Paenibacillus xylanexedens]MDM5279901.1 hypothetical protein [Paenibacillus silvae]